MRKSNNTTFSEQSDMLKMARSIRLLIRILGTFIIMIFSWLKFSNFDFSPITDDLTADFLLKFSLIIMFASWFFGCIFDINLQEEVYLKAPSMGKISYVDIGLCIMITLMIGLLCWVKTYKIFSIILLVFWLMNFIGWIYLTKKIRESVEKSQEEYLKNNDCWGLESLMIVHNHISGYWRLLHLLIAVGMIVFIIILAFTELSYTLASKKSGLTSDFVTSLSILSYILFLEIWMWYMRVKTRMGLDLMINLKKKYVIQSVTTPDSSVEGDE